MLQANNNVEAKLSIYRYILWYVSVQHTLPLRQVTALLTTNRDRPTVTVDLNGSTIIDNEIHYKVFFSITVNAQVPARFVSFEKA